MIITTTEKTLKIECGVMVYVGALSSFTYTYSTPADSVTFIHDGKTITDALSRSTINGEAITPENIDEKLSAVFKLASAGSGGNVDAYDKATTDAKLNLKADKVEVNSIYNELVNSITTGDNSVKSYVDSKINSLPTDNFLKTASYNSATAILTLTMVSGEIFTIDLTNLIDAYDDTTIKADIAKKADKVDTYTKTEVDNKIDTVVTSSEINLSNYYDKSTTDSKLSSKADKPELENKQDKLIAGTNITISGNTISSKDTVYDDTAIKADVAKKADKTYVDTQDATKQDKLTAGTNITISGNTISATDTIYNDAVIKADIAKKADKVTTYTKDEVDNIISNIGSGGGVGRKVIEVTDTKLRLDPDYDLIYVWDFNNNVPFKAFTMEEDEATANLNTTNSATIILKYTSNVSTNIVITFPPNLVYNPDAKYYINSIKGDGGETSGLSFKLSGNSMKVINIYGIGDKRIMEIDY